jgi:hypothetical protein
LVYQEIVSNEEPLDDLAKWIKSRRQSGLFIGANRDVQKRMTIVSDHVLNNYEQHHAAHFLSGADPWLIAHALPTNGVVVTHESNRHPNAKVVRIPDVCATLGVPCIDTYEMLRRLGADFRPTEHKRGQ